MDKIVTTLNQINISHKCKILKISDGCKIKQRLREVGLADSKNVRAVLRANNITAYEINGALIAIRDIDSSKIYVREVDDIDG